MNKFSPRYEKESVYAKRESQSKAWALKAKAARQFIAQNPGSTASDVFKATECGQGTLFKLLSMGLITVKVEGKERRYYPKAMENLKVNPDTHSP